MNPSGKTNAGAETNSKPLIFIVDDEPLLLELAVTLLSPAGYELRTFLDPDAALRAFVDANRRPDLILTDYAMHTMTGLDLIRECRRIAPRQRIILVSGTVDENIFKNSPVKPDGFLPKPYQGRQLITLVESLLAA
jgi:two-component system cell cycle sensor histidine kinase/response regulator CckA